MTKVISRCLPRGAVTGGGMMVRGAFGPELWNACCAVALPRAADLVARVCIGQRARATLFFADGPVERVFGIGPGRCIRDPRRNLTGLRMVAVHAALDTVSGRCVRNPRQIFQFGGGSPRLRRAAGLTPPKGGRAPAPRRRAAVL
jgi:hypothetical protein